MNSLVVMIGDVPAGGGLLAPLMLLTFSVQGICLGSGDGGRIRGRGRGRGTGLSSTVDISMESGLSEGGVSKEGN
ncbi:uncharacterized protein EI90DRAFT_3037701 [Cantharellus anzutake]|uniref:uncharacterized protein n=1 Tax=Cantharellus anzutake TaxID=1750568 RepID=UPI00190420DE|nr:uncharacterized protein EI90DRAFT_3037701 [Cantharellus anzutake]KAF8339768.1 hypothetical protein EI90DRAFT_3037701 [Cantharellus anzutake]